MDAGPGEKPKRRLPVLQSGGGGDAGAEAERPPWHWSAIGAVATFLVWLPLALLASALLAHLLGGAETLAPGDAPRSVVIAMIGLHTLAFALGAFVGGAFVGRFGGTAGRREATASGGIAATVAWGYAAATGARSGLLVWGLLLVVMGSLGAGSANLGGRLGLRLRSRGV